MADDDTQREAVRAAAENVADRLEEEKEYLTDLDSAIGDADHGANMSRGFRAAAETVADADDAEPADLVKRVGTTLISEVGGASGPLYGGSIMSASQAFADDGITAETSVDFAEAYLDKVEDRGDARIGAKTMVDALTPAVHTYKKSIEQDDLSPLTALAKAVDAAERGVDFTVPIRAEKGRASYLGWRSVGHQDPGATSTLYIMEELLATAKEYVEGEIERDATAVEEPDEDPADVADDGADSDADGEGDT
ncbi:dihydroxyacetone kinase subunit DhaL [Natronoarchaeum rubrum]|uniref:dihydroxyacetone kinase subunit DhaL n=1 Tax=Natronoarchaeum rubrum TaxID=755311 RepID=UPI00211343CB|nr:dihydroxyacetone kinase subunit DhaL [Natronoarchaeum rubrum]